MVFIFNRTPLHCAAYNGHLKVVEYLVNQKADMNAKDNSTDCKHFTELLFI